jgi:uncharacterized protein (TIGR03086 family)
MPDDNRPVAVGGCRMATTVVTATGALEIAVHGWDITMSRGRNHPLPEALAAELLPIAADLIRDRTGLFDPPVPVDESAGAAARLVAFLGRSPV